MRFESIGSAADMRTTAFDAARLYGAMMAIAGAGDRRAIVSPVSPFDELNELTREPRAAS